MCAGLLVLRDGQSPQFDGPVPEAPAEPEAPVPMEEDTAPKKSLGS